MPVLGRTREQLRQAVGYALPNKTLRVSSASANGATTTVLDNSLPLGTTGEHRGKYIVFTSTNNNGLIRRVTTSTVASNVTTLTFYQAATNNTASGNTYELWDGRYEPAAIHRHLDQAIMDASKKFYDPVILQTWHGDNRQTSWDWPASGLTMIKKVEYRDYAKQTAIHLCDAAWDESVDGDVTASRDAEDYKRGGASFKMVVVANAAANDILATDNISSLDISGYNNVELWIKSTVATNSADLQLLLDNTASCASPLETLNMPALVADTWTWVQVSLANPELDTALISVGLKYTVDIGACTIWLDDIQASQTYHDEYSELATHLWHIEKNTKRFFLSDAGRDVVGYSQLRITGGDTPALLTAETSTCEVPEDFIVARATEYALRSLPASDPDRINIDGPNGWAQKAEDAYIALPILVGIREVS